MIFVTIASEAESQALMKLTRQAVGRVAQRAWMILWSAERVPVAEIAPSATLPPENSQEVARYQRGGALALLDLPRSGRLPTDTVMARQAVWAQVNQPPGCFGYINAIWTLATLCQHLAERCGVCLSCWKVRTILHALRYRFTRPKAAPRRTDLRREEINQQIGRRISEVRGEKAVVIEDETDIRLFPVLRRMWQLIGEQWRLVAPAQNEKRTIFGTIDIETGEVFHRTFARKRTAEMIALLTDLLAHYGGQPMLVVLDHASIHKSKALLAWVGQHPEVELIYLPRYGGHLDNPIEKLWWHLKGSALANRCCRSIGELLEVVERYFAQLTPEKVFQLVA